MSGQPGAAFLCFGRVDECLECGGINETGTRFCSHDCAASQADRVHEIEVARDKRRDQEAAFADAAERLRLEGRTDEEIDQLLIDMP